MGSQRVGHNWVIFTIITSQDCIRIHHDVGHMKVRVIQVMSNSLQPHRLYNPWNSPGRNTEVGSLSFLQGIFPTQGLNPGLPYCRWLLYQLSHKGTPRILEWVAYPFFSRCSQPRSWTGVFCTAGGFFTKHTGAQKVGAIIKSKRI